MLHLIPNMNEPVFQFVLLRDMINNDDSISSKNTDNRAPTEYAGEVRPSGSQSVDNSHTVLLFLTKKSII